MKNILIVGGTGDKPSGVIYKLYDVFKNKTNDRVTSINGSKLPTDITDDNLVLWMPDISNEEPKDYPVKAQGSVLICSKVMRKETTRIDAVTRIFNMHGNAVIAITKKDDIFEFELIDALNNTWIKTTKIEALVFTIESFYNWTIGSKRVSLKKSPKFIDIKVADTAVLEFLNTNKQLALKVAEGCGNRFFGNYSTRCTRLFPTTRLGFELFFFSPRNVAKQFVTEKDLVLVDNEHYYGDKKPSVDTPVQLELYKIFPRINYMIHGHAYIKNALTTEHYYPCGDLREVQGAEDLLATGTTRINLKNHGFLLTGASTREMREHLAQCEFIALGGK